MQTFNFPDISIYAEIDGRVVRLSPKSILFTLAEEERAVTKDSQPSPVASSNGHTPQPASNSHNPYALRVEHRLAVMRRFPTWGSKEKVVLETLQDDVSLTDIAKQHGITPDTLRGWRHKYFKIKSGLHPGSHRISIQL